MLHARLSIGHIWLFCPKWTYIHGYPLCICKSMMKGFVILISLIQAVKQCLSSITTLATLMSNR